jgi:hypothetical protein
MQAPSKDIASLLTADSSLSLTFATNLFIAKEPATSINNVVTVFDGVSRSPMLTMTKGENYYYDAVQIRVRNTSQPVGYALAFKIMESLHGCGQTVVNGTLYTVIYCSSGPALMGWDDNGRVIYVLNFEVQRRAN